MVDCEALQHTRICIYFYIFLISLAHLVVIVRRTSGLHFGSLSQVAHVSKMCVSLLQHSGVQSGPPPGLIHLLSYLRLLGLSQSWVKLNPHFTHMSWLWVITWPCLTRFGTDGLSLLSEKGWTPQPATILSQDNSSVHSLSSPSVKTSIFLKGMKRCKNHATDSYHFLRKICLWKTPSHTLLSDVNFLGTSFKAKSERGTFQPAKFVKENCPQIKLYRKESWFSVFFHPWSHMLMDPHPSSFKLVLHTRKYETHGSQHKTILHHHLQ